MNDKDVINKLIKIAENQQKILHRLAQNQVIDENKKYLYRACETAAVNSGLTAKTITITYSPGSSVPNTGSSKVTIEDGYLINLSGISNKPGIREKFTEVLRNQVRLQKPELTDKFSISFQD